ncbi:MAG: DUF2059 domain-containing protein [Devosia sp.]
MSNKTMTFPKLRASLLMAVFLSLAATFAAVPANAQELAPEHLAVARKYIELTDKSGIYEVSLVKTAIDTMRTIISQNPEITKPVDDAITKTLEVYKGKKSDLLDQFARVYALNFTIEELQEIVTFYESPVGAKLATANATLNQSLQTVMQVFETNLKTEFFAKVRAELKAGGYDV